MFWEEVVKIISLITSYTSLHLDPEIKHEKLISNIIVGARMLFKQKQKK